MAFLDVRAPPLSRPGGETLTAAERLVLRIARTDSPHGLRRGGRAVRAARWLIGMPGRNPLACPRLEALRRYAVLLRADRVLPAEEMYRLRAARYGPAAIAAARTAVCGDLPAVRAAPSAIAPAMHRVTELAAVWLQGGTIGIVACIALPVLRKVGGIA